MNAIKYGAFLVALSLSTAAFAASGDNVPKAAGPSGAASGEMGGAPAKLQERRSAKESPTNNPADAPTGVGGDPKALGTGMRLTSRGTEQLPRAQLSEQKMQSGPVAKAIGFS